MGVGFCSDGYDSSETWKIGICAGSAGKWLSSFGSGINDSWISWKWGIARFSKRWNMGSRI